VVQCKKSSPTGWVLSCGRGGGKNRATMFDAPPRDSSSRTGTLMRSSPPPERLAALAIFAAAAGSMPLPVLPPRLLSRVRGAVVHDVAARHGLSLTNEARRALGKASIAVSGGAVLATLMFFLKRSYRRLGAVGILPPLSAWLEVYSLGILLDRYIDRVRTSATVRIDEQEARAVRRLIDRAVRRALSPNLKVPTETSEPDPAEDLRDMASRLLDGLLLAAAALPTYVRRRLAAAFDEVAAEDKNATVGDSGHGGT
jgi:hypothetical protein